MTIGIYEELLKKLDPATLQALDQELAKNIPAVRKTIHNIIFKDWLGICVYEPERMEDGEVVWHLRRKPPAKLTNILTIGIYEELLKKLDPATCGEVVWHLRRKPPAKLTNILTIAIYEGHAFVIKDITKLAKTYACVHCRSRFTKECLQRHIQTCAQGKTVIDCPAERVELPQTSFEKAFYPKHSSSPESLRWLEQEAALRKIHIHHAACGHGGERWVERAPVEDTTMKRRLFFNITDVTGMDAENVTPMIEIELLLIMTKHEKIDSKQL